MREKEYELLYNGITKSENIVSSSRNLLYTVVAAIYAFAFTQGTINPFYFLTPFFVIIPAYHISITYVKSYLRIAAYLMVFYEHDSDVQWQTRIFNLRKRTKNNSRRRYINYDSLPYLAISLICLLFYFNELFSRSVHVISFEFVVGIVIVFLIVLITLTQKTTSAMEEDYLEQWEIMRKIEKKKS